MIFKNKLKIELKKRLDTRYGENPHQKGAFYLNPKDRDPLSVQNFKKIQGKEISFNNLLDIEAAIDALAEMEAKRPACVILKHTNPCGAAYGKDIKDAFLRAWYRGDSLAAFGGIIGVNREVDGKLAQLTLKNFFEILVAPKMKKDALEIFRQKPKTIILTNSNLEKPGHSEWPDFRKIRGGFLVQEPDLKKITEKDLKFITKIKPTEKQIKDLIFAWKICKVSKSNAIVLAKDETLISSGVGQQDRKRACQLALKKAGKRVKGTVAASDGFFPFPDGPEILIKAGVRAIIQPGGSIRDKETIKLCDKYKIPMVFTGVRCFKH
ncbi:MAG: hypothetical protein COT33_00785 [Candidatus Nealsonbacteria bacterium CG08_land_8_20_14_0_20_38_20]|uniref:Bifunctional phosphoribosylaminoimidazolecarboxamide formyltransferase/IMP cyclohydrolase PurH n=1 Tax=Candidatus Nealsonbacteria bacterium CG08_land_8_20_14_0_20_38_20 TaxID=1974705 RepID=A0A2H0YPH1_9BACT|nr:MAG: hypothetical protein COT33_00785 [Candidatus Nealsonbacteria bacterium CG08_land_8_20_14_0_20_38_20]